MHRSPRRIRLVIVHEAVEAFGVGAEIAACARRKLGFDELDAPIDTGRCAVSRLWPFAPELEKRSIGRTPSASWRRCAVRSTEEDRAMTNQAVLIAEAGGIATITINRPKALNALDIPTLLALETVEQALADKGVKVLIFRGAGDRAFVAGGDIGDLNLQRASALPGIRRGHSSRVPQDRDVRQADHRRNQRLVPGGGTELLLCLDMRIAGESARIGVPEIKLGLFPGAGGSQRLIRQVSPSPGQGADVRRRADLGGEGAGFRAGQRSGARCGGFSAAEAMAALIVQRSPLVLKLLEARARCPAPRCRRPPRSRMNRR